MDAIAEITAEVKNVPTLRFLEFEGEWKDSKLVDFCTLQRGFDLTNSTREEGNVPVYSSSGLAYYHNVAKVKGPGVVTGRKGIVGNVFYIEKDFWPHDTTLWVNNFHSNDVKFVYWFLLRFGLKRFDASTSVPTLNRNNIHGIKINYPSFPEQQKIASFLSAVDDKIQQLSKKKELLERYKKGVMQQIFSQQIRFKDDNGNDFPEWEEKRLGEIGKTYNGLTGKTKENFGEGKPYIQYKQIFDNSRIDITKCDYVEVGENERQSRVLFGDVFFTVSSETPNEIGTASVLLDEIEELYLNSFCFGYRPNSMQSLNPHFARHLFRSSVFRKDIVKLAQGSTRYNMSKVELMKLKVYLPCHSEQVKIANFLTSIDNKINYTSNQLEQAQQFKKGLLQQMFV